MSLSNKTVLITGASSGIGLATAKRLAKEKANLLLCARRIDRLKTLAELLKKEHGIKVHSFALDVSQSVDVDKIFDKLPEEWQNIDVLINNAGLARGMNKLHEGNLEDWEEMIDTNLKGLLYVTRKILPTMVKKNSGHIINLGSIAGHQTYPNGNVYCATKFAVRALSESMRADLLGSAIRVSLISPGMVETEFSQVRFRNDHERAKQVYEGLQPLTADDVADTIAYVLQTPAHVNINEIIIMPVAQASAMLTHRKPFGSK